MNNDTSFQMDHSPEVPRSVLLLFSFFLPFAAHVAEDPLCFLKTRAH